MFHLYVFLQIVIRLNKGLGISLVDRTPEELVYIMFRDVAVEYVQENEEQTLRADVRSFQVNPLLTHIVFSQSVKAWI